MKKLFFISLMILGITTQAISQFSNEVWHEGFLVTTEDDTLKGMIKYDMEANIVQLVIDETKVKTFSSHKIFYFEIYDKLVKNYRQFYSVPYQVNYNYTIPIIFEVLYEAELSLLAREAIVQESVPNASVYWGSTYTRNKIVYTFYFLDKQGKIRLFTGKKNDLLMIMAKKAGEVKSYMKKNKLKPEEIRDLIRITAFYNSI